MVLLELYVVEIPFEDGVEVVGIPDVDLQLDVVDEDAVGDGDVEDVAPARVDGVLQVGHGNDARRRVDLEEPERMDIGDETSKKQRIVTPR